MGNEENLEKYLSEFQPRAVSPLTLPRRGIRVWPEWLAIAAALLVCGAIGFWYARRGDPSPPVAKSQAFHGKVAMGADRANSFALTQLALTDEAQFEAQLAMESRKVLPNFTGQSTLRVLSTDK